MNAEQKDAELLANSPFDDEIDLSASPPSARPGVALYLGAGLVLVAGFLGGVQAQKWSSDDATAAAPSTGTRGDMARAGGYPGGGAPGGGMPGGGMPGGGSTGGQMTIGTVIKIQGDTLYLRNSSGKTVQVKTNGTTKVQITKDGKLRDLGSGTAVVVRGTTGTDGTVTATTVNQGTGR